MCFKSQFWLAQPAKHSQSHLGFVNSKTSLTGDKSEKGLGNDEIAEAILPLTQNVKHSLGYHRADAYIRFFRHTGNMRGKD